MCVGVCLRRCHVSVSVAAAAAAAAAEAAVSDVQIFLHDAAAKLFRHQCQLCVYVCVWHACIDCLLKGGEWRPRAAFLLGVPVVFVCTATAKIFTFVQFRVSSISAE